MRMLPGCPKDLWRVDVTWCEVGRRRGTVAARDASRRARSDDRSPRAALVACGSGLDPLDMKRPLACSYEMHPGAGRWGFGLLGPSPEAARASKGALDLMTLRHLVWAALAREDREVGRAKRRVKRTGSKMHSKCIQNAFKA